MFKLLLNIHYFNIGLHILPKMSGRRRGGMPNRPVRSGRGRALGRGGNAWHDGGGRGRHSKTFEEEVEILDDLHDSQWSKQRKRQRRNTDGISVSTSDGPEREDMSDLENLSVDDKLNRIMQKLLNIDDLSDKLTSLEAGFDTTVSDVSEIKTDIKEFDLRMRSLEYKALDQEARGRRNNLLFWGIQETESENCEQSVLDIINTKLEVGMDAPIAIQRAHRVGQKATRYGKTRTKPRPIVICFRDYKDVENVLSNANKLKGTNISIGRDYPKEINDARQLLWPKYKEAKKLRPKKVFLKFPAQLVINKVVVEDCFPNWSHFIHGKYMNMIKGSEKVQSTYDDDHSQDSKSDTHSDDSETEGDKTEGANNDDKGNDIPDPPDCSMDQSLPQSPHQTQHKENE